MTRSVKAPNNTCPVCMGPGGTAVSLCDKCMRSYEQTLGGDTLSVIVWAAGGAERERARLAARLKRAGLL